MEWLSYLSPNVLRGEIWRVFTYGLVNPPSLWFAIEMLMMVWFGREVERYFGRRKFFTLYACVYLIPPLLRTLIGTWRPTALAGESGAFALFIAFATLYPNAVMLFNLLAKWVAWVLVGIYALQALSVRDGLGIVTLAATVGFAYGFVRYQQGRFRLPSFALPSRDSAGGNSQRETGSRRATAPAPKDSQIVEVDALLDKIAQSGLSSLTAKERAKLDAARENLRKRTGR
jgi:hypothetical protein